MKKPYKDGEAELHKGANPTNFNGLRKVDCPFSSECLDYVLIQNWDFFSCEKCPFYKKRVYKDYSTRTRGNFLVGEVHGILCSQPFEAGGEFNEMRFLIPPLRLRRSILQKRR